MSQENKRNLIQALAEIEIVNLTQRCDCMDGLKFSNSGGACLCSNCNGKKYRLNSEGRAIQRLIQRLLELE